MAAPSHRRGAKTEKAGDLVPGFREIKRASLIAVSLLLTGAAAMAQAPNVQAPNPAPQYAPPAAVKGFTVNGFTQGMHESQAKDVANKNGLDFHDTSSGGVIISKGSHADSALFCKDELVRYTQTASGGFLKFLREIRSFEGQGYRRTNLDLGTQMGADGKEAGHLTVYFFRPGDYFFVTVTLLGNEDNDTDSYITGYESLDKIGKCQ